MRLVHLTDPHLSQLDGVRFSQLRGKRWSGFASWHKNRQKKYLPAVLDHLASAVVAENADQILLTGDLIQIGLESEVGQASGWLRSLGPATQVMLVPGNHDIYAKGSAAAVNREWSDYLFHGETVAPGEFPVLRKRGKFSFIGLSTACVTPVFMASGALGETQLQRLAVLLEQAAAEQQLLCLLIHHPPLPGMTNWRKGLTDASALQAVLASYPPQLMFHGHLHHNRERQWGDCRVYCTAAASSAADASYRVIDIEDQGDSYVFRSVLKSIAVSNGSAPGFTAVDEQSWQLPKNKDV